MDVFDFQKVAFGMVWKGVKSPHMFDPNLMGDYKETIELLRDGKPKEETALKTLTRSQITDAEQSFAEFQKLENWNDYDVAGTLSNATFKYNFGKKLERVSRDLVSNREIDLLPVYGDMTSLVGGNTTGLQRAIDIDYKDYRPFMKSGYAPIDDIVGGIPTDGPIVTIGSQGTGKSHFNFLLLCSFLKAHPDKTAAIYTLEMSAKHFLSRELEMYPEFKSVLDRLYVSGSVRNIEELVGEVTAKHADIVGIDDMDRMVKNAEPSEYQRVYTRISEICRFLEIPVHILAQPNRFNKEKKEFLNEYAASWSGAAENSAAMFIALQKVDATDPNWSDEKYPLPNDGFSRYYMMFLKSRDGWPVQAGPGAIRLEPSDAVMKNRISMSKNGKYKQLWVGKVFQDKLHVPMYGQKLKRNRITNDD